MPRRILKNKSPKISEQVMHQAASRIVLREVTDEEVFAQRKRERIMFVAIAGIMIIVAIVWVANIRSSVQAVNFDSSVFDKFSKQNEEFSNKINANNLFMDKFKNVIKTDLASSTTASATVGVLPVGDDYNTNIDEVNQKIENIINNSSSTLNKN